MTVRHSVSPYVILHLSLSLITVARVHSTLQPCSSNQCDTARLESKLIRRSNDVHLIPWEWTLVFKRGSTPRVPTTTSSYEATTPRYEECSRFSSGALLYSHSPLFSHPLTIVKITHFSATYIFCKLLHIFARWWCDLTMTNFYRRSSNCQLHNTVQIVVVSMTVLTTMTTHNTALGTTVLNAPHFLCPAKVSAHVCLPLTYITID